ncbi:MAG: hypothetical protein ACYCZF_12655 [Anaerolineae bacterium]
MNRATRILASTFGAIAGLVGIVYGIFEILQGNAPIYTFVIDAVGADSPFWRGGPVPAVTIISSMLVTGVVAVLASALTVVWAAAFIHLRWGGGVLIMLAIEQLMVGGGIAQPMLAIIIGLIATRINSPLTWWRTRLADELRRNLARLWPVAFMLSLVLCVLYVSIPFIIGINGSFLGSTNPNLGLILGYAAIVPFNVAVAAGLARDSLGHVNTKCSRTYKGR